LTAARYLAQRKVETDVVLLFQNDALRSRLAMQCKSHSVTLHFNILQKLQDQLNVQMTKNILADWLNEYDLVVDAISMNTIE
jgi:NAD(P)H-hydrate epimerase